MGSSARKGALFLDRDGTLIEGAPVGLASPAAHSPSHVKIIPGVAEALHRARHAGLLLIVVTNQPGPAKGQYRHDDVVATNAKMEELLARDGITLDAIYVCEHHPIGAPDGDKTLIGPCDCRKPKPGMLVAAMRDHDVDPKRSAMIGDVETDLEAGRAAGLPSFRVASGLDFSAAVDAALAVIAKV